MTDLIQPQEERRDKRPAERPARKREVVYPVSDGKPMAETDLHRNLMFYFVEALGEHFRHDPLVYVSGNNFLYWEQGNPRAVVSPDTYVVFGVPKEMRDCYMAWKLGGRLPEVVFEFTSKKTRREDVWKKRPLYEQVLKVPEYFQFDPTGDYLRPRLQGFRLEESGYVPLEVVNGRLHSQVLGLDLVQDGNWLRLYDPKTDRWLLTPQEQVQRAEAEAAKAREAEARAAQLQAELEALRKQLLEREKD